ncbi:MAG: hypothetical protein GY928_20495 [Colwellia sp.]|nr:hypothetical protein [Colwellia sp.]
MLPINFSILSDDERISISRRLAAKLGSVTIEQDPIMVKITTTISEKGEQLNCAIGRTRINELTSEINATDDVRDENLQFIYHVAKINCKKSNDTIREAGEMVVAHYKQSEISLSNNTEESEGVARFLTALSSPEGSDAIVALRLTDEVTVLTESNDKYIALVDERVAISDSDTTPRLTPSRRELNKELNFLEEYFSFQKRQGSDLHIDLIEQINGPISEIMTIAKARKTRKEN